MIGSIIAGIRGSITCGALVQLGSQLTVTGATIDLRDLGLSPSEVDAAIISYVVDGVPKYNGATMYSSTIKLTGNAPHTQGVEVLAAIAILTNGTYQNVIQTETNIAPSDITLSSSEITEGNTVGDIIGALTITDPNAFDTYTLEILAVGDYANYAIDENENLIANAVLSAGTESVTVRATDAGGLTKDVQFVITVNAEITTTLLTGLISAWKLTEASGGVAVDSASRQNGTVVNAAQSANGITFDGNDDLVDLGASPVGLTAGTTALTVSIRLKPADSGNYTVLIAGSGDTSSPFYLKLVSGVPVFQAYSTSLQTITASAALSTTEETHVLITWSANNNLAMYINGVADGTLFNSARPWIKDGDRHLTLGGIPNTTYTAVTEDYNGLARELYMWNKVVDATEIGQLATDLQFENW